MDDHEKPCKDRVKNHLTGRMHDLRILWKLYCDGDEDGDYDLGTFCEYGLSFDYVAPYTFKNQPEGYFRYQLSWGGPSDEFRFYANRSHRDWVVYRIEYWFLDWFDGAGITLQGEKKEFMEEIFQFFNDVESCTHEYEKAMED